MNEHDPAANGVERQKLELEKAKLWFEREKFEFEKERTKARDKHEQERANKQDGREIEKHRLERTKAAWTALAVVVPVVSGALTIGFGVYNLKETARYQFSMKAAEIAFDSESSSEVKRKAEMIEAMFKELLSERFSERLKEAAEKGVLRGEKDYLVEPKGELIRLLAVHPQSRAQLIQDWRILIQERKGVESLIDVEARQSLPARR